MLRGQRKEKGLSSTEFGQFNMQGKVGDEATEIVWKAYQTLQGWKCSGMGSGTQMFEKPASVTVVNPADASSAHGHGHGHGDTSTDSSANDQGATEEAGNCK